MAKKKARFKDQMAKRFNTVLAKSKKQLAHAGHFNPTGFNLRTLNSVTKLRICLDFLDISDFGKKNNKKLKAIDAQLGQSQKLLAGLMAYQASAAKLDRLFPKKSPESAKFKASVMDLVALEKRAVKSESMIKMHSLRVHEGLGALKSIRGKGGMPWLSEKKVKTKLAALDILLKKLRKSYEASFAKSGPRDQKTLQLARQLSAGLNAAVQSYGLLNKTGLAINQGKARKYKRVERRVNNFLRFNDINTFIRKFQSTYGSLSNEQLGKLLASSDKKISGGFSLKKTTPAKIATPANKTTAKTTTPVKRGRPKKVTTATKTPAAKTTTPVKRGRPKKKVETTVKTTTRRRGRPRKPVKNDLTKINGIGPVLEKALNSAGIISYSQLASLSEADHAKLDKKVSRFHGRARRVKWAIQAAKLMEG